MKNNTGKAGIGTLWMEGEGMVKKTTVSCIRETVSLVFVLFAVCLLSFHAFAEPAAPVTDVVLNVNAKQSEGVILTPSLASAVRTLPDSQAPTETARMMGTEYTAGSFADKYSTYDDSEVTYNVADFNTVQFILGHMDGFRRDDFTCEIYLDDQLYGMIALSGTMMSRLVTIDVSGKKNLRIFWEGFYGLGNVYGFTETVDTFQEGLGLNLPSPTDSTRQRFLNIENYEEENIITEAEEWPCYEYNAAMIYPVADKPMERFYMMGREYGRGVCAEKHSIYDLTDVSWNIGGRYQKMQFELGHLDGAREDAFGLEIYLDENYYGTVDLTGSMMNQLVTIDVSDITKIRLSWQGSYGLGNIIFTVKKADGENIAEGIPAPYENAPTADAYTSEENPTAAEETGLQPSEGQGSDISAGNDIIGNDGAASEAGEYISPYVCSCALCYPVENKPVLRFYMMGEEFGQGLAAEKTSIYDDSEASFNIGKKYDSLEFTVGHMDGTRGDEFTMQVYLDEELSQEIPLSGNMMNESFELDVTGVTKVRFWWEGTYGIGNIICR